jgi:Mg/Co/Ni transporter MgtE
MRAAVEINYVFGLPMPVIDKVGRLIGVVGTSEIFSGILQEDS